LTFIKYSLNFWYCSTYLEKWYNIAAGVTNAINMINAIDGIGLAAFGVALAPMGFMVTLRVLNMVLSRV